MDVQALFFCAKIFHFSVRGFFCRFLKQERSCLYFEEVFSVILENFCLLVPCTKGFGELSNFGVTI